MRRRTRLLPFPPLYPLVPDREPLANRAPRANGSLPLLSANNRRNIPESLLSPTPSTGTRPTSPTPPSPSRRRSSPPSPSPPTSPLRPRPRLRRHHPTTPRRPSARRTSPTDSSPPSTASGPSVRLNPPPPAPNLPACSVCFGLVTRVHPPSLGRRHISPHPPVRLPAPPPPRPPVVPINFVLNLLATLTACLVMVYVNSSRTSEAELVKLFGDPCATPFSRPLSRPLCAPYRLNAPSCAAGLQRQFSPAGRASTT